MTISKKPEDLAVGDVIPSHVTVSPSLDVRVVSSPVVSVIVRNSSGAFETRQWPADMGIMVPCKSQEKTSAWPAGVFGTVGACLGWLSAMDRNGLWSEYVADFHGASMEHGDLDLESLQDVIREMLEE